MTYKIVILFIFCFPFTLRAQTESYSLCFQEAMEWMSNNNPSLQIADKAIEIAYSERQKLNALWFPALNASGMYVHMSNKIEVRQSLDTYTTPAKRFVQSILPDEQLITSILDKVGSYTLSLPLLQRNLTTIDANLSWPIFTGGKRIYASRIGNRMIDLAQVGKDETQALLQTELIETYYALNLAAKVVEVRKATYQNLQKHYEHALKLEANGMITKAERLFAMVNSQEAKREWESAKQAYEIAHRTFCSLLNMENSDIEFTPVTPLFIIDELPDSLYFKSLSQSANYTVNKLRLEESIANNQLRISQSAYLPNIALLGKHTLYAQNIPSNLMPRTMIGIGFTWNLFDGLNREADVRTSRLTKQSLILGREEATNKLNVMIDELSNELQQAEEEVSTLQATIAMSKELLRIRRKSFEEGMSTSTEVVDAEVMLSKVQIAQLMAYYQFDVSLATLCAVCGVPEMFWTLLDSPQIKKQIWK